MSIVRVCLSLKMKSTVEKVVTHAQNSRWIPRSIHVAETEIVVTWQSNDEGLIQQRDAHSDPHCTCGHESSFLEFEKVRDKLRRS